MLSATACVAWLTGGRAVDVADRVGKRRDGLATNHGLVEAAPGGWRLRAVVDEYQCLCSEYRSNAVTHNYFDGSRTASQYLIAILPLHDQRRINAALGSMG